MLKISSTEVTANRDVLPAGSTLKIWFACNISKQDRRKVRLPEIYAKLRQVLAEYFVQSHTNFWLNTTGVDSHSNFACLEIALFDKNYGGKAIIETKLQGFRRDNSGLEKIRKTVAEIIAVQVSGEIPPRKPAAKEGPTMEIVKKKILEFTTDAMFWTQTTSGSQRPTQNDAAVKAYLRLEQRDITPRLLWGRFNKRLLNEHIAALVKDRLGVEVKAQFFVHNKDLSHEIKYTGTPITDFVIRLAVHRGGGEKGEFRQVQDVLHKFSQNRPAQQELLAGAIDKYRELTDLGAQIGILEKRSWAQLARANELRDKLSAQNGATSRDYSI